MIYFLAQGGLGNMLFQVAAATSFAESCGTKISIYNLQEHLAHLNIETNFNPNVKYCFEYQTLNMFNSVCTDKPGDHVDVITFPFHYEPLNIVHDEKIIFGFFQSEKYFKKHESIIKNNFKPTPEINKLMLEKFPDVINNKNTTSIHIRRGDYIKNQSYHPLCSIEYYLKAVDMTRDITDHYYIFGDDPEWCKKTFLGKKNLTIMENNRDYIDMYLMSCCTNNIISNSSLSWWGAWLNNNVHKKVISPNCKNWFGPALNNLNPTDIIPDNWIQL